MVPALSISRLRAVPRLTAALALVVMSALACPVGAQNTPGIETEDGRRIVRLLELCTARDTAICDSYIDGFLDGYWLSNTHSFDMFPARSGKQKPGLSARRMADKVYKSGICVPDGIYLEELRTVLVGYLEKNKDEWKDTWYQEQLWNAFRTEYPCVIDTEMNTDTR